MNKSAARSPMLIPLIIACALFMENLDSTVIATALPAISDALHESVLRLNLAITCYLLSLAVFIPLSGWMADRFGARTVFRSAIAVFTLGSMLCGLVDTLPQLILARILQGMGGAMMMPVGRLVLLKSVPKSDLVNAMAYFTMPALLGPVLGPPLGGFIVTYWTWRWIFYINVPIGILGIVLATLFIDNDRDSEVSRLDVPGFLLTGIGLATLVFGFESAGRGVVPNGIVAALILTGAACLAIYVRHARQSAQPIIDLSLLRIPTYATAVIGGTIFRVSIGALPFLLPLLLQLGFGMSAFRSGLITLAGAAGAMVMKVTATPIIRFCGYRPILVWNAVICTAILTSYCLFTPATSHLVIFVLLAAGGFFRSLQFTCINTLAYANIAPAQMSRATSLASMAQQLALSLGVGWAALTLHLTLTWHGGTSLGAGDFAPSFIGIGVITFLSLIFFWRLSPEAGEEVRGRVTAPARNP